MDTLIIGQGYNTEKGTSVAKELIELFESQRYDSFTCLVAFASYGGISALTPYVLAEKKRGVKIKVILGVDQGGTSKEALDEVLSWGVDSYVYHTRSINIFHPKVYLFENTDIFTLIVGSNNLTEMGLVKNIECSLLIKDIRSNPIHREFYDYWKGLLDGTEVNLHPITSAFIKKLCRAGIVASEFERKRRYDDGRDTDGSSSDEKALFERATVQCFPEGFRPKRLVRIRQGGKGRRDDLKSKPVERSVAIDGSILLAELSRGGKRWRQVNFPIDIFENFFGARRGGGSRTISLTNIAWSGIVGQPELRKPVVVKSHNYRFEINCKETAGDYPGDDNRPIGIFAKVAEGKFLYQVLLAEHPFYASVREYLLQNSSVKRADEMHRCNARVEELQNLYPDLFV